MCHPGHGHTAQCDALQTIEERLAEEMMRELSHPHGRDAGRTREAASLGERALLMLGMWRAQPAGVRDPDLDKDLNGEYVALAARVQSHRLNT